MNLRRIPWRSYHSYPLQPVRRCKESQSIYDCETPKGRKVIRLPLHKKIISSLLQAPSSKFCPTNPNPDTYRSCSGQGFLSTLGLYILTFGPRWSLLIRSDEMGDLFGKSLGTYRGFDLWSCLVSSLFVFGVVGVIDLTCRYSQCNLIYKLHVGTFLENDQSLERIRDVFFAFVFIR